jgi:radical SAM superfamily enzyme
MPDKDGIEGPYRDGRGGCAWCQAVGTYAEIEKHRKTCGRKWRQTYGAKRGPNRDELLIRQQLGEGDTPDEND